MNREGTVPWRWGLAAILAVGVALRLAALSIPSVYHPDEIYQYLEAAHRIVFGYGVVTWEYRAGMRSWLLPLLLSGPMAIGNAIAPTTGLHLLLPRLATLAASGTIIWSAWIIGARTSRTHAAMAALAVATWYELVAIAAHPLGESTGLATAVGGAALLFGPRASARHLFFAGMLLTLTCVLRFQYGPGMLCLAGFALAPDLRRRVVPMACGVVMMLALSAAVDLTFGATPFAWLVENVRQNIVLDRAADFGVSGPLAYLGVLGTMWGWATVPIVIAAYVGARRCPALFCAAIVHFVLHSLIGHKEDRFILLTIGFAIILAGMGTVDLVDALCRRFGIRERRSWLLTAAVGWVLASALLAARWERRPMWTGRSVAIGQFAELRGDPKLCGVGVLGIAMSELGGYVVLHRRVPLYLFDPHGAPDRRAMTQTVGAYNALVLPQTRLSDLPSGFVAGKCRSTAGEYVGNYTRPEHAQSLAHICIYRRAGGCDARARNMAEPFAINQILADLGM